LVLVCYWYCYLRVSVTIITIIFSSSSSSSSIVFLETVNATVNILPNGIALDKGQSLIVTEGMIMMVQQNKRMLSLPLLTLVV
jgi:hypothetical protein